MQKISLPVGSPSTTFNNDETLRGINLKKSGAGFTLIELLLVVSIVLIIGTFSAVFYTRFLTQNAVANTQDQLIGQLRKAQIYSMMGKQNSAWSINYSSNTITLYIGTTFAGHNTAFDEKFTVNSNITVSGITNVNFARMTGLPTPTTSNISISSGTNIKTISISSQGVVSR